MVDKSASQDQRSVGTPYRQLIAETASAFTPGDVVGPDDMPAFTPRQLQVVYSSDPSLLGAVVDSHGDKIVDALHDQDYFYASLLEGMRYHARRAVAADVQDALDAAAPLAVEDRDQPITETNAERRGAAGSLL